MTGTSSSYSSSFLTHMDLAVWLQNSILTDTTRNQGLVECNDREMYVVTIVVLVHIIQVS
jgi:hypothetical protein